LWIAWPKLWLIDFDLSKGHLISNQLLIRVDFELERRVYKLSSLEHGQWMWEWLIFFHLIMWQIEPQFSLQLCSPLSGGVKSTQMAVLCTQILVRKPYIVFERRYCHSLSHDTILQPVKVGGLKLSRKLRLLLHSDLLDQQSISNGWLLVDY
jgi:hypothetical protein